MAVPTILAQHAEEAAFLWLLRDEAVGAPHHDLDDLARLDERVEAHLDGLRVAGDAGWDICEDALAMEEAGEVFAAAVLAFESDARSRLGPVFEAALADPEAEAYRGLVSALGWVEWPQAWPHIERLLDDTRPERRRAGIAGCAIWRADPGAVLAFAMADADPALRARAFGAAGELGRVDLVDGLRAQFADDDETCRFPAARSAVLLGDRSAFTTLAAFARPDTPFAEPAIELCARAMPAADAMNWLRDLSGDAALAAHVVRGIGAVGDPAYVPWLIEQMAVAELARPAGDAFATVTGVDIALEDLDGEAPEEFEPGPNDDPDDDDVAMDPDEDLATPDPERIAQWWQQNQSRFQPGTRYLLGQPVTPESCRQVLVAGYQRQRRAAAIEIALTDPAMYLFEVRAPGARQQRTLGVTGRAA